MGRGFTVQSLEIEGFKGFTARQRIDFDGRHVFLLGQNGNGKSSIIEAVRWGLFGSARRPNEIVANQGYGVRCRVDISLVRDGVEWHLRRTLNMGTSGGSDAVLTDAQGTERRMQEIMPQLDSVDAGEGMHIIFAPHSAPPPAGGPYRIRANRFQSLGAYASSCFTKSSGTYKECT